MKINGVRCFHVLVRGKLCWTKVAGRSFDTHAVRPAGFYRSHHVLAPAEAEAARKASMQARADLNQKTGWISSGAATLLTEVEEIGIAPFYNLLRIRPGYVFYDPE